MRSPHLQTVWGPMLRPPPTLRRHEEKLTLRDGDHLWLTWAGPTVGAGSTLVLILHGLSGSYESHYARGLQSRLASLGVASVVMNARGTANRPNDKADIYHAGQTADIEDVINTLRARNDNGPILPVGYSLGGSRLLNYLADNPAACISAAVAVSVPLQLALCSARLDQGVSRVYRNRLLGELLEQLAQKHQRLQQHAPHEARRLTQLGPLAGIRTFRDFDNHIVAPLHGFRDADDYYAQCSTGPKLTQINTPTLILHAQDDPFMLPSVIPEALGPAVQMEISRHGGHVGFVAGPPHAPRYWLEERIPTFLARYGSTVFSDGMAGAGQKG